MPASIKQQQDHIKNILEIILKSPGLKDLPKTNQEEIIKKLLSKLDETPGLLGRIFDKTIEPEMQKKLLLSLVVTMVQEDIESKLVKLSEFGLTDKELLDVYKKLEALNEDLVESIEKIAEPEPDDSVSLPKAVADTLSYISEGGVIIERLPPGVGKMTLASVASKGITLALDDLLNDSKKIFDDDVLMAIENAVDHKMTPSFKPCLG